MFIVPKSQIVPPGDEPPTGFRDHSHDTAALSIVQCLQGLFLIGVAGRDFPGEIADHPRGVIGSDGQAPAILEREAPAGKVVEGLDLAV